MKRKNIEEMNYLCNVLQGYVIVYDVTNESSFQCMDKLKKLIEKHRDKKEVHYLLFIYYLFDMQIDIRCTMDTVAQNSACSKIHDGDCRYLVLMYSAISQSPMNMFLLNLVHK